MKDINKIIIFAYALFTIMVAGSFLWAYLCSYSLLKVLDIWLTLCALAALGIGIEKMSKSETGAALLLFGGAVGYIIYCICKYY